MPPSPAIRCSPGREPRADNHKRGRSLESGIPLKQRDDDLALFNEVQNRERDNFLLQGNDDFEDIFANKLRHFSDYKLGINIPCRGETSDLLHAEDEKNDYEWLITPPDTPLFPSLDEEAPQVDNTQRGRTRTQPITISRMEKGRRSSRGSASPNRVSISPRSHNNTFESRHRVSSASPPTTKRPTTTRSPPPSLKPSSPAPRSPTPPPRRLSTGSNGTTRGIRGNSASPKVKAWQASISGFSTEVPPNLRTSLADRPASYVRGSSPASRSSRQSPSRSVGSSHSHSHRGSSAEDDMESLSSVVAGRQSFRRGGGFQSNRASPSKKPSRVVSSSSAPKRSFDLALRQMDHRKGQNMFRPLLSSVPSSTFYSGGVTSSPHHPMISRNSSVTSSSNASSGLAISGTHDHDAHQDDATSSYVKVQDHDIDDEVFMIEKDPKNTLNPDPTTFDDVADMNTQTGLLICSKCGCDYSNVENDTSLCKDCMESDPPLTFVDQVTTITKPEETATLEPRMSIVESLSGQQDEGKKVNAGVVDFSNTKVEGAGISILLKRSSSIKGAVVRNTNFSASSISYDDLSFVRDSTNSMRSVSASSSVDFGQMKHTENTRFQRQLSSTKSEKSDAVVVVKHQRSGSSLSGTSSHAFHPSSIATSMLDSLGKDVVENNQENMDCGESLLTTLLKDEDLGVDPNPCMDHGTDVSEGECDHVTSKCDVSLSSMSSIEELIANSNEDHDNYTMGESVVLVGHEGRNARSLTLEEATDTILFCSSIVHNLAHNAATIAIEKENQSDSLDNNNHSWPLIPATKKSDLNKPDDIQNHNTTKRSSKSLRSKHKKDTETDPTKSPNNNVKNQGKIDQQKTRIVRIRDNMESKKPPLLESKCNCIIM